MSRSDTIESIERSERAFGTTKPNSSADSGEADEQARRGEPRYVVGIGASAGGLEALKEFFSGVPADSGLCFVVIQHLSPDYKSLMVELLAKEAAMPIKLAEDGLPLEPDTTYVIPPGKEITVEGLRLNVTPQQKQRGPHLPVDLFLQSLAGDVGNRSIAVILSGTGSDGVRGVREVKHAGGMIMVQTPESAKFEGMPASAEETGLGDYVLQPEHMGRQLIAYANHTAAPATDRSDELLSNEETKLRIFARIRERHKVDFTYYRMSTILRRIQRRMGINRITSVAEYARLLDEDVQEVDALYRELLIGVTSFFRDPEAFDRLGAQWEQHLAENPDTTDIRCWIAGCSTGEEAYSVVITLLEAIRNARSSATVKAFATDIDQNALAKAAVGRYPESIAADVSHELLARYFVRKEQDFQVTHSVRERVVFAQHDLVRDPPFTNIDLVSCRNLLIYLQPVLQRRVLEHFSFALRPGAVLFLGSSEATGDMVDHYEPLDHKWKIYRSRGERIVPSPSPLGLSTDRNRAPIRTASDPRPAHRDDEQTLSRFVEAVGADYLPLVLIANEALQLVHLIGDPDDFVRIPTGKATVSLANLIVKDLAMPVNTGLQKVFGGETEVQYTNVRVNTDETTRLCRIRLRRLPDVRGHDPLAAVIISRESAVSEQTTHADEEALTFDVASEQNRLIDDLQQELQFTRENLQATIEELETANEELQATNEELMASNEELQSTNEELQSVNEELHTVNAEYQEKIIELTELNNDLENLFGNTDAAMLFLDENLVVRRCNDQVRALSAVSDDLVGKSFRTHWLGLEDDTLQQRIRDANQSNARWEGTVAAEDGRWYLVRLRPYRLALEVFAGVTLTLIDVTTLIETQEQLANSRELYARLLQKLNEAVVVYRVTEDGITVEEVNEAARTMGGIDAPLSRPVPLEEIWPNVELFGIPDSVRTVAETGESRALPPRQYNDDQLQLWATSRFYRIGEGRVVGVFSDVSEESRLQHLLRAAGLAWWEWNYASGRVEASDLKSELIGCAPDEIGPALEDWTERIHGDDYDRVMSSVRKVLQGEAERFDHVYRLRAKDGSYRTLRDVGSVTARRPTGEPTHLVGWVQAVDEPCETPDE